MIIINNNFFDNSCNKYITKITKLLYHTNDHYFINYLFVIEFKEIFRNENLSRY